VGCTCPGPLHDVLPISSEPRPALARIDATFFTCAEKVERFLTRLCESPTSVRISPKKPARLPSAHGMGSPARIISAARPSVVSRSEEHTAELQSRENLG